MTPVKDPMRQMTTDERLTQFGADYQYFRDHADELFARYPEEWIGVLDGEVVLHNRSGEAFYEALKTLGPAAGRLAIEQATRTATIWLL